MAWPKYNSKTSFCLWSKYIVYRIFKQSTGYAERVCRTQLPTIFSWSKPVKQRREIIKYDLPSRSKAIKDNSLTALSKDQVVLCTDNTILSELNLNDSVINQQNSDLDNKENKDEKELVSTKVQTEQFDLHDSCKQEAEKLKEETRGNFVLNQSALLFTFLP